MFLSIITFLVVFTVIILVHELGHFLTARKAGIRVEEFGFGYPPRALAKKIGKTTLSLNWLPFGGFVKLLGEDLKEGYSRKNKNYKEAFWYKSRKQRAIVIISGVTANFLLAIVCFSIVYSLLGIPTETERVNVVGILSQSPAETVGLKENDVVLEVDGQKLDSLNHFIALVDEKKGEEIGLLIGRGNENLTFAIEPRETPPEGEGPLGVIVSNVEIKKYPLWQMPFRGTVEGFKAAITLVGLVASGLGRILSNLFIRGQVPTGVAGPVGIMHMTGIVAHSGIMAVLQFVGLISVNLAIINILPFPALDGGRLLFIVYEAITKRRPKPSFEAWTNAAGMAFLIIFLLLVTINDIKRIFMSTDLLEKIKTILPF